MLTSKYLRISLLGSLFALSFMGGLSFSGTTEATNLGAVANEAEGFVDVWTCEGMFDEVFALQDSPPLVSCPSVKDIFKVVEQMPRFPGCEEVVDEHEQKTCADKKLLQFIFGNIEIPAWVKTSCNYAPGMAVVQFCVETNGSVSNVKLIRDPGGWIGEAGLAVVNSMNEKGIRWEPGRQNGQPVRVEFNLPVRVRLE